MSDENENDGRITTTRESCSTLGLGSVTGITSISCSFDWN